MADTQGSSSGSNKTKASVGASKGSSVLPQARVNRIVKSDKDIAMCSKEALFLISVATEEFLKKLTLASYTESRSNKRKGIQYKDLATAIQQDDAYFYLQEVVPVPVPLQKAVKARKRKTAEDTGDLLPEDEETTAAQPSSSTLTPAPPEVSVAPPPEDNMQVDAATTTDAPSQHT